VPVSVTPATSLAALADLVRAGGVVILSGAGISTESGIPDYRGPGGVRKVTSMQYAEFTGSSAARQRYWARSFVGWQRFSRAAPNDGHRAVVRLQQRGFLDAIITQNVDGLHQAAGAHDVRELHGSLEHVVCLTCSDRSGRADLHERMSQGNPDFFERFRGGASQWGEQVRPDGDIILGDELVEAFRLPRCLACGTDTLKPDVVFFGESVPRAMVDRCFSLVEDARSLLVLGSSLAVMSGYRFVRRAVAHGIPVGIVTESPTRADAHASVRLHGRLGETLVGLGRVLGG